MLVAHMPRIRPRRPRVTNPPEVVPLVVLGFVAVCVAQLAIGFFGSVVAIAVALAPGGVPFPHQIGLIAAGAALLALNGLLLVLGWMFVRRLTAGWFRRQTPAPVG